MTASHNDWDFGDSTYSANANPPTHTYIEPGAYLAILTVTDSNGLSTVSPPQEIKGRSSNGKKEVVLTTCKQSQVRQSKPLTKSS